MRITSIILGVISIFLLIISALISYTSFYAIVATKGSNAGEMSVPIIITIVLVVIALLCALIGGIFGIIGLFGDSPNKATAFVGIGLNIFSILAFIGTIIYIFIWLADNVKGRPFG